MTDAHLWAFFCALMLFGWAVTLFIVTRSILPQANSLKVLERVDSFVDTRVAQVIERARHRAQKASPPKPQQEQREDVVTPAEALSRIFGESPLVNDEPILEQPDASLDVME